MELDTQARLGQREKNTKAREVGRYVARCSLYSKISVMCHFEDNIKELEIVFLIWAKIKFTWETCMYLQGVLHVPSYAGTITCFLGGCRRIS